jgi:hypothetical protein
MCQTLGSIPSTIKRKWKKKVNPSEEKYVKLKNR